MKTRKILAALLKLKPRFAAFWHMTLAWRAEASEWYVRLRHKTEETELEGEIPDGKPGVVAKAIVKLVSDA